MNLGRREVNGTVDDAPYNLEVEEKYQAYIRMIYAPSLTEPAIVPARPTGVFDRNANSSIEPTLKTIIRKALGPDIAGPTGFA